MIVTFFAHNSLCYESTAHNFFAVCKRVGVPLYFAVCKRVGVPLYFASYLPDSLREKTRRV